MVAKSSPLENLGGLIKMMSDLYRGKRVLVTGHTGFKGSWLCQWLLQMEANVCGFSRDIPTKPSHFEILELDKKIQHHLGDVCDLEHLSRVVSDFKPEIVFHLAAQPLVRLSYDNPKETFDTNVGGTVNVLENMRHCQSVQVAVLVASDKCYENLLVADGYKETDRLGGSDPYSASKACAEIVFQAYQRSFFSRQNRLRAASVRAGNVIGGGDWALDRIVPDCMQAWGAGQTVKIRNPASIRPWQHVLEPVGGYLLLGAHLWRSNSEANGASFNFGPENHEAHSVETLLNQMKNEWPKATWHVEKNPENELKKEAGWLRLNCEKVHKILDWSARLSFEESVQWTTRWYRAYYEKNEDVASLTIKQITDYGSKMNFLR